MEGIELVTTVEFRPDTRKDFLKTPHRSGKIQVDIGLQPWRMGSPMQWRRRELEVGLGLGEIT